MSTTPVPRREAAFIFILITVALDMLALGVVIPVLPKLIVQFEGGDLRSAAHAVGVFGFAWAGMQFLFQPVLGALSDHYGRRPVVLASNLGLGLDYVFMALAPSLPFLFVGRLISGVTAASVATANAYISDITPPEKRAGRFGLIGAAFGLGFILGPAIGGALGEHDLRFPFWAAAFFSLANFVYGWFILPESLAPEKRTEKVVWRSANVIGSLNYLRTHPTLALFALALFLSYLAHESLPGLFVLYTEARYHWDASTTGWALAIVGISQTVVSGGLVRPTVARLGEKTTFAIALASGALGFLAYAFAPTGALFMAAPPLIALWGMANPSFQGLATRLAGQSEQGRLQGAFGSLRGVSGMVGPLLFTQIFAMSLSLDLFIGAGYFLAGLLLAASLFIGLKAIEKGSR
ncbi:TCR/Tet family MFS transporter [Methylocystis parvus]|uniref:Tetracycline resistance MFS efflux pump n=1 Tax=Methylocystis parvus TaxID=134 RepID=A0A6B8MF91_9HYPH|nr:tetracycline resistance MFS efflux pump [Methylocystis parvus]QGM99340.1 tetracycline resistance MFS efflux pump [Methylocystis parvus]WBK00269.1 tetracycline resistance MFS efflux pump [Methylocystis parvus OBBP]